jgi:hypothetical protein
MMKNYNKPYFSFNGIKLFIKLKKNHISDFGNTTDLIIINGRRDVKNEQKLTIRKL